MENVYIGFVRRYCSENDFRIRTEERCSYVFDIESTEFLDEGGGAAHLDIGSVAVIGRADEGVTALATASRGQ